MNHYRHTQNVHWILAVVAVVSLFPVVVTLSLMHRLPWPVLLVPPIFLVLGWNFRCLTIEVSEGELRWRFGPGWIRKKVQLKDIVSAEAVRTNLFEGWGIHYSRFGWLYNVSGFNAVALTLKNGSRFCLGTDEPAVLIARLGLGARPTASGPELNPRAALPPGPS